MDSLDQARDYAIAVGALLDKHKIPPTPENYLLWYTYVSRRNMHLRKDIDALIAKGATFTDEVNQELHANFLSFEADSEGLYQASDRISSILTKALGQLHDASNGQAVFGDQLDDFSKELNKNKALGALAKAVDLIVVETRQTVTRSREIESELRDATSEISTLKQNLENARKEAMTDPLTGIANRKSFDHFLREGTIQALQEGERCSLLMIDIDHFKKFNDNFGHQIGDEVLKLVARTLVSCVKGRDTPARFGGEEFAIILPDTRLEGATQLAQQICRTIAGRKLINKSTGKELCGITVSLGVAEYILGESIESLIERTDQGLYRAKENGRNRVEEAPSEMISV